MLINLRNALMTRKRTPTAKDYVQSGLVAMWDGIENAGWGVHDANATTWKDLIGSYDATLTAAGSFSADSLVCTGGEQEDAALSIPAAKCSDYIPQADFSTVEAVFRLTSKWGNYPSTKGPQILFAVGNPTPTNRGGMMYWTETNTSNYKYLIIDGRTVPTHPCVDTVSLFGVRMSASAVYGAVAADRPITLCARNGIVQTTRAPSGLSRRSNAGGVSFGGAFNDTIPDGYYGMSGEICCVRVYGQQLTASEIARNYAIDKARFNLP
jgi:hypothetical protein